MAQWKSFSITVPGQDIFDGIRGVLETLLIYLEVLKAILDTVKTFLIDFGNPIAALVQALIALIESLFNALKQTGLYALFDFPDGLSDKDFEGYIGGYAAFSARWKGSLYDSKDSYRPQPVIGGNQSGYVLIYVEDSNLFAMLDKIKKLLAFFGGSLRRTRYAAPVGLQVFPLNDNRDPVLSVTKAFQSQPTALAVEWQLPSDKVSPSSSMGGLLSSVAEEFIPPSFLIERTTVPGAVPYTVLATTQLRKKGAAVQVSVPVREPSGDPYLLFESATTVEPGNNTPSFLSGALGTYRFIDTTAAIDQTYYYRVRAFSGTLTFEGDTPKVGVPKATPNIDSTDYQLDYQGTNLIMGAPTPIVSGRIPQVLPGYDVVGTLEKFFQVLFSLDFHRTPAADATFNTEGVNTGVTGPAQIGRGAIPALVANVVTEEFSPLSPDKLVPSPVTGNLEPPFPWENGLVTRKSKELANRVASSMLENSGTVQQFRSLMLGPLPRGPLGFSYGLLSPASSVQQIVESIPIPQTDFGARGVTLAVVGETYLRAFADSQTRLNLLSVYQFVRSFTFGVGQKPNWFSISLLRDVVPWSGQILYEILAKIHALVDAYNGVLQEIKDFIDLIERKITTLERFIQFIIDLLDSIQSLSISAKVLFVDAGNGGIPAWTQLLDSAVGDRPTAGPKEYTASITLAYSAVDAAAYKTALGAIFGGI